MEGDLKVAPSTIFIAVILLIIAVGHLFAAPGWLLPLATLALTFALVRSAFTRRREKETRADLGQELTEMQRELERRAARYLSLLEGAGNAIFVFNADTGLLEEMNHKGAELFGFQKNEMAQLKAKDLFPPKEYEKFGSFVMRLKRRGKADVEGLTMQCKDGSLFEAEIDAQVIELNDERVVHCIVRDVSAKLAAQREIQQRNRELSILNEVLAGLNREGNISQVLEKTLGEVMDLFGALAGVIHLPAGANLGPACSRNVGDQLALTLAAEVIGSYGANSVQVQEKEALPPAARAEGWCHLTAVPLLAGRGPVGVMHLLRDEGYHYPEAELRFLAAVGRQMGSALEKSRLFDELNWKSTELLRSHHLLEKASHNLTLSEAKLRENLALVEQANVELSRLDRMKNQFLGMVSHEFNTPLTSIIAGAEHLLREGGGEEREVLEMVRNGGLRLKELVADLLKLIRLEARGGELNRTPLKLHALLALLREQFDHLLAERRLSLSLSGLEGLPFFNGDVAYLERVFSELLLNAIKFTPEGGEIEVSGQVLDRVEMARRREKLECFNPGFVARSDERCYLEVEVRDNGIGIPAEELRGIFEIFYEIGEIRHHSSAWGDIPGKGAGLGLAIVKGMVEAHGGMVWAESGEGSSFFLILPLEPETPQPALF